MFGYHEAPYTVLQQATLTTATGQVQRFEVRAPSARPERSYIALEAHDAAGKLVLDRLLTYNDQALLAQDWQRLTRAEVVAIKDLQHDEEIVDHHVGYMKDGGVAMY